MNGKWIKAAGLIAALAVLFWLPIAHLTLVVVNLVVCLTVLGLQAFLVALPRIKVEQRSLGEEEPFVSIHVPAYNEPPELLKQTLKAISKLDWENYEVLIIDNNTKDEAIWRPIEEYCQELGPKFRFFHVENMKGFKAGAMNYIRERMDERTQFIFVVDSDYVVTPNAIKRGLSYFTDEKVGMVQFPQDYRNVMEGNRGITMDFKHFFSAYMNMANRINCVPSTGTLSFLRIEALRAVKGFGTAVITEDADLGLKLGVKGYRAVYGHESIGQGVMPYDLTSLKKQRWRWAFGNAQILKLSWRSMWFCPQLSVKQKLGFFSHLTAWFNFNLIPTFSLLALLPLFALDKETPLHQEIAMLSGVTLLSWLVLRFSVFYNGLGRDGHSLRDIVQGFATHVGLGWIYSSSWLECLGDHRAEFVRTNKFLGKQVPDIIRATLTEAILGIGLLVTSFVLAFEGYTVAAMAALLTGLTRFLIYWVWQQMRLTYDMSVALETGKGKGTGKAKPAKETDDNLLALGERAAS